MKQLILISIVILGFMLNVKAQDKIFSPENEMTYRDEESYKSISFLVNGITNEQEKTKLINLIKSIPNVFLADFNIQSAVCSVETKLDVEKENIVAVTGHAGYKVSEYSQEVHLMVIQNTMSEQQRKIQQNVRNNYEVYYREDIKNTASKTVSGEQVGTKLSTVNANNKYEKMTVPEKIKHIENLKIEAEKKGESTQKYDIKLNELKTIENK